VNGKRWGVDKKRMKIREGKGRDGAGGQGRGG